MIPNPAQTSAAPKTLVMVMEFAAADGMNSDATRAIGIVRDRPTVTTGTLALFRPGFGSAGHTHRRGLQESYKLALSTRVDRNHSEPSTPTCPAFPCGQVEKQI